MPIKAVINNKFSIILDEIKNEDIDTVHKMFNDVIEEGLTCTKVFPNAYLCLQFCRPST